MRDLLLYLTDRVLDGDAGEIHEQEVGHKVFDRSADYDTSAENIVRVHASMLRKRLEQYFASEGAGEPLVIEIPKGNYAPVFRPRDEVEAPPSATAEQPRKRDMRLWILAAAATLFACSTAYLLVRGARPERAAADSLGPTVKLFWAQVFSASRPTDIVLDDASVGLYQELTGHPVSLSNYFDRTYLRGVPETAAAAKMDPGAVSAMVLRRQSSFAASNVLWRLFQVSGAGAHVAGVRFARDYTFRELKANNAVLLGNSRSNPWVEPFESSVGLRWMYDSEAGVYYPVDTWDGNKKYPPAKPSETHEGYCAISLLPNLGHTGNVLVIAGTGGSAVNGAADFLADEQAMSALSRRLGPTPDHAFPHFEALIKVKGRERGAPPRDATVVVCRKPRA